MARYYVTFLGRRRGAVGQPWPYARIVSADTPAEAVRACSRSHEALAHVEYREIDEDAPALPHDRLYLRPGVDTGCGKPSCTCCYVIPMTTDAHRALSARHARSGVSA